MQALHGVWRIQARDVAKARQAATGLGRGVEQGRQHRRKVADHRDLVAVDQFDRLGGVVLGRDHVRAAGVEHAQQVAESRDVEERQRHQVTVRSVEPEGRDLLQVGVDQVRVAEQGAARDHVDRGGGDDGERRVGRNLGPRQTGGRFAAGVESLERRIAGGRIAVQLEPVWNRVVARATRHGVEKVGADDEGSGLRPFPGQQFDFALLQPPVDGVDHDSLASAREVELDVGRRVLGQHGEPVAGGKPEVGEAGSQGVHAAAKLREALLLTGLRDQGQPVPERGGVADQDIVERE